MAPIAKRSNPQDDFVLTISDDDQDVPVLDEEEDATLESYINRTSNGTKRKRDAVEHTSANGTTSNGTDTAARKRKKRNTVLEADVTSEPEDQTWAAHGEPDGAMDSDFEFQIGDASNSVLEDFSGWGLDGSKTNTKGAGNKTGVDIDELIARRRGAAGSNDIGIPGVEGKKGYPGSAEDRNGDEEQPDSDADGFVATDEEDETLADDGFGMGATNNDEEKDDNGGFGEDQDSDASSDNSSIAEPVPHPDDQDQSASSADEREDPEEHARREAFFAPEVKLDKSKAKVSSSDSFQRMQLSRPILRGLAAVGFSEPTPIQTKTIPVALLGKDVVGGAVTGSGKTAAFIIPILERLLYRPKKVPTSRVAILMPTRELAVQCFNVAKKLASFTDVTFCQLVGGFSLREQEKVLRSRPDVVIATPGRFIDHMRNSASFTVDTLEILILDEADRMLEDGFADELNEILATIPKSRQTMLFSATMTDKVDKLIRVGLNRPVRLMVDARKQTVGTLVQEFVRLRPGREDKRLGYLMYLCNNVYTESVLIFFRKKSDAHRVRIVFGLCDLKAAELHGSMSQEQRIAAVEAFRSSAVSFLLATDVASRGLDIKNISTVINYEAPQSHEIYLHRVGRTARAGRTGRACTIAAEPDRKVVKAVVKAGKAQGAKIVSRAVDVADADAWAAKIATMTDAIDQILQDEKEEKQFSATQMQLQKGENIIDHRDEILARPKRTWFESERDKQAAKKIGSVELNGEGGKEKKKIEKGKAGKLSGKEKKRLDDGRERVEGRVWKKGKGERGGKVGKGGGGGGERGRKKEKGKGGKGGKGGGGK